MAAGLDQVIGNVTYAMRSRELSGMQDEKDGEDISIDNVDCRMQPQCECAKDSSL